MHQVANDQIIQNNTFFIKQFAVSYAMGNQTEAQYENQYQKGQQLGANCWKAKLKSDSTKLYQVIFFQTNHEEQAALRAKISNRQRDQNIYLQRLVKFCNNRQQGACSDTFGYNLIFREGNPNLGHHCKYRMLKKQRFASEEVMHVIRNVGLGLQYLRSIGETHGLVDLNNIIVNEDIYLKDPMVVEKENQDSYKHRKAIRGFPSPQKLRECYDMVSNCEQQTWDLYSLGIVALQMLYLDVNLRQAYKTKMVAYNNSQINYAFIKQLVDGIQHNGLKQWIGTLLHPQQRMRRHIYYYFSDYQYNSKRLKLLRQNPLKIKPEEELIEPIQPFKETITNKFPFNRQSSGLIPISHSNSSTATQFYKKKEVDFLKSSKAWENVIYPIIQAPIQPKNTYINQSFNYTTQINCSPSNQAVNLSSLSQSLAQLSQNLKTLIETQQLELSHPKAPIVNKYNYIKKQSDQHFETAAKKNKDFAIVKRTSLYTSNIVPIIPEVQDDHSNITDSQYVTEQYQIGTKYEGFKKKGKRNGNGKFYYTQGSYYQGEWKDNKMNGFGTLTYSDGSVAYQGQWKNDQFQGRGILYNNQSIPFDESLNCKDLSQINSIWSVYEGKMHNGQRHGFGRIQFVNGESYEGEFFEDFIDGEGTFYGLNELVIGQWRLGIQVNDNQSKWV